MKRNLHTILFWTLAANAVLAAAGDWNKWNRAAVLINAVCLLGSIAARIIDIGKEG